MRPSTVARLAAPSVLVASVVLACSSSSTSAPTKRSDAGTDGGGGDGRTHDYPSFNDDVMPVFVASCALTACHGSLQSNLNIFISGDPAQVFGELQKTSPSSGMKFVTAGDPKNSYVMLKMDGEQATQSSKCPGQSCGTEMPPADTPGTLLPQAQRDAVRAWITAGATND